MKITTRNSIKTKYLAPTNFRGSRIVASLDGRRITVPLDYAVSGGVAHAIAATAWLEKHIPGATLDPNGMAHGDSYYWSWTY